MAVILAFATMQSNDANTRKIVDETKTADWWAPEGEVPSEPASQAAVTKGE